MEKHLTRRCHHHSSHHCRSRLRLFHQLFHLHRRPPFRPPRRPPPHWCCPSHPLSLCHRLQPPHAVPAGCGVQRCSGRHQNCKPERHRGFTCGPTDGPSICGHTTTRTRQFDSVAPSPPTRRCQPVGSTWNPMPTPFQSAAAQHRSRSRAPTTLMLCDSTDGVCAR
jgi:hypothetical protein